MEVLSPDARDPAEIAEISLGDYLLNTMKTHLPQISGTPWVMDAVHGTSVKFGELEDMSKRIASALTRLGFKKGDVLYFVTYEAAMIFVVQLAVWRLGGITRGHFQNDTQEFYTWQIKETFSCKFILVDEETAPILKEAINNLEWPVTLLSFGQVEGATSVSKLLQDDGSAFPKDVRINPREDVVVIPSTSGSTGKPKGVLHTHYSVVASLHRNPAFFDTNKIVLTPMVNFTVGCIMLNLSGFCSGGTVIHIPKFQKEDYFTYLIKYKPDGIAMFPYLASWFVRSPHIIEHDLSFLKVITIGAWVLDHDTVRLLHHHLPQATMQQVYGMTESMTVSSTRLCTKIDPLPTASTKEGDKFITSGRLLSYVKVKVVDPESGRVLNHGERGEILVHAPHCMLGYLNQDQPPNRSIFDPNGYMHTGDLGFCDSDGNIYIIERLNFMFKYHVHIISPSEIEAVLQEHEAVHGAGVVGIPNLETTCLARALVVLRPERQVSATELVEYVAARLPLHKHLHGGVTFIDNLPVNRGGKLDRQALRKIALQ